ncbi:MAG: hypothetical protein EP330_04595 [Deltaproteobacteria bacterium]|nr:MAG: hypothetical protein EP330_04595 [Deltaproteobacteria bacterium]
MHRPLLALVWTLGLSVVAGCGRSPTPPNLDPDYDHAAAVEVVDDVGSAPGSVIVFLLDDVGVDKFAPYELHPDPAYTPVLDALAAESVLFRNAWAEPSCSPMRAAGLTGRNPTQTGIGRWIHPTINPVSLRQEELTLAELLADEGVTSAVVGKWHLRDWADGEDPSTDALDQGFERHRGSLANPDMSFVPSQDGGGYYHWEKNVDGVLSWSETYMTVDAADEAIAFLSEMDDQPFFLWLAFNAPHLPLSLPPASLVAEMPTDPSDRPVRYSLILEAVDTEIGRILGSMTEQQRATTTLIVLGDNGTANQVMTAPSLAERSKDTVFDGGVRVPLLVAGPYVQTPGWSDALVQTTDLFATVAHVAGIDTQALEGLDSASFLPQVVDPSLDGARRYIFAEEFHLGQSAWTVRDATHKLIERDHNVRRSLHRYEAGAFDEGPDLLEGDRDAADSAALRDLKRQLDEQRAWMQRYRDPVSGG